MGKVVKAVVGIGLAVVGFVTGAQFLIVLGLSLASQALLTPSLGGAEERQASETTLSLGEQPREVIFGEAATGGSLIDAFNFGGEYGTDWEVQMVALADHECEALVGFYVNDEYYAYSGDGTVSGFNSQFEVHFLPGTASQQWPAIVLSNGPGWTANDRCAGMACVVFAYKADDPEAENPVWPGGRPRFLSVVKGKRCYDARKDSTVAGGSGSHRYDDPSTWEWTDNANVCRYQFQRGIYALDRIDQPDQLLLGRGLSELEAPPERAIAHSNTCDELVALDGGGTEKRYTFNGLIGADEDFLTAESYFTEAMGGVIRQPEGGIEVEPGQAKPTVAEITDLDILNLTEVEIEFFRGEQDREWVNTVIPRYVEPAQKWKMHGASIRRDYDDVIADGGQRTARLDLKPVTQEGQAQRLGEIRRRIGRLQTTGSLTLGPRFVGLEEGDWIGWTSERHFGGQRKVFRIEAYDRGSNWHMALQLREIAASVYAFDDAVDGIPNLATAVQVGSPPPIAAPNVSTWTLTGGEVSGARGVQPALFVTGAIENSRAQAVRVEYRVAGQTSWTLSGDYSPGMVDKAITGVADEEDYDVAISYVVDGEPGARRVLGPVTTGMIEGARGARWIASRSVSFPLTSDDDSIEVEAFDATLYDGSAVSFPADLDDMTGLTSGTTFGVFFDPATQTYLATPTPSATEMADRSLIFVGAQSTSDGGTFTPETPPDGYGGGGYATP